MIKELLKPVRISLILIITVLAFLILRNSRKRESDTLHNPTGNQAIYFNISFVEDRLESLEQTDPQLIQYARVKHLAPPTKLQYNLKGAWDTKDVFASWVAQVFKNRRNGRFIEAGAHEGERGSHTLYLEQELGWSGLLIECNPTIVPFLKSKHRKAWIADVCLSPNSHAGTLNFSNPVNWTFSGTLNKPWNIGKRTGWSFFDVQTMPLYTILAALGWNEVDYFSFDIEGQELSVLKTFPFHLFVFKLIIIEDYFYSKKDKAESDELLIANGYVFVKNIHAHDRCYVHNNYQHLIE